MDDTVMNVHLQRSPPHLLSVHYKQNYLLAMIIYQRPQVIILVVEE